MSVRSTCRELNLILAAPRKKGLTEELIVSADELEGNTAGSNVVLDTLQKSCARLGLGRENNAQTAMIISEQKSISVAPKSRARERPHTIDVKPLSIRDVRLTGNLRMLLKSRRLLHSPSDAVWTLTVELPLRQSPESRAMRILRQHSFCNFEHAGVARMAICTVNHIPLVQILYQSLRQGRFLLDARQGRGSRGLGGWDNGWDLPLGGNRRLHVMLRRYWLPRAEGGLGLPRAEGGLGLGLPRAEGGLGLRRAGGGQGLARARRTRVTVTVAGGS